MGAVKRTWRTCLARLGAKSATLPRLLVVLLARGVRLDHEAVPLAAGPGRFAARQTSRCAPGSSTVAVVPASGCVHGNGNRSEYRWWTPHEHSRSSPP